MLQPGWLLVCHLTHISLTTSSMSCTGSQSWLGLDTRSCSWLLSPNSICVSSCLNRHLPAPLVRCALLIVVIFLHLGPVLLYPRIGPLLWWVLHYGMTLLLHFGM